MALETFEGKGNIFVNGQLQANANDLRKSVIGNNQKVYTFHKDLAIKAGKRVTYAGWIDSYDESDAVNGTTSYNAVFQGKQKAATGGILGAIGL